MTKGQEHLLKLLKELDEICRENDIQYFIAGGTLIGSVRHRGFVPWDDDADLYMTRDNFLKLVELAKNGKLPNGRTLECQELSREYFNVFARYIDCTSTAIHKAQLVTNDTAGQVIDILQLDPIPSSKRIQKKHFKNLLVYSDLANESTIYLHRQNGARFLYKKYLLLQKIIGKDRTLSILEKKMFNYPEKDCDYYFMRWGGTPLIFDKDMFSEQIWIPYENIETSIPKKYNDYLIYHYGEEWDNVPDISEQMSHAAVHCLNTEYKKVKQTYIDLVDKKEIEINQRVYKKRKIKWAKSRHKNVDVLIEMKGRIIAKETTKAILDAKLDLNALYEGGDYSKLCSLFDSYYKWQGNAIVSGRDTYVGLYRYTNPLLVELPLDILVIALRTQMDIGKASKSYRTIEIYEYCKKELPEKLVEIKKNIEYMRKAFSEFTYENYAKALELADLVLKYSKNNKPAMILKIKCMIKQDAPDEKMDEIFISAMKVHPKDVEIKKLWIDYYYSRKDLALEEYKVIRPSIINGFTRLDLQDREHLVLMNLIDELKKAVEEHNIDKIKGTYENILKLKTTQDERIQCVGLILNSQIDDFDYKREFYNVIELEDIKDWEEYIRICERLLVAMGEEKDISQAYVMVRKNNNGREVKEKLIELIKRFNENAEPVINLKLKKLYADLLCTELNVKEAYGVYMECIDKLPSNSIIYCDLLDRFYDDINQIEYMEKIGAIEMRKKNISVKFGNEKKYFAIAEFVKDKFDKRNSNEQVSEKN